jgi:hypothetical protein
MVIGLPNANGKAFVSGATNSLFAGTSSIRRATDAALRLHPIHRAA